MEPSPSVEAAGQLVATLASAMRCEPSEFADSVPAIAAILDEGGWPAPALATHLVAIVVGGVRIGGGDSPAASLAWRIKHLPRTCAECPCRSCRSWRSQPAAVAGRDAGRAAADTGARPEQSAPGSADQMLLPDLSAIEQAAAAGARQAAWERARAS
ncbi:MAG: hypothetical protein IRZ08_17335 [Frankia sp.]|nr:hypothetical protein [Frankia sp.]